MKIFSSKNYRDMSNKAANIVAANLILKANCTLGLDTGPSFIGLYDELADKYNRGMLDFSQIKIINLDEYRGIGADHPQSCAYFMKENFSGRLHIDPSNTHGFDGLAADPVAECARYEALLQCLGGVDLQLLSLGPNGQLGYNGPSEVFQKDTYCVDFDETALEAHARFFKSLEETPCQAYTMGIRSIMSARKLLLVANGEGKAELLYQACFGPITPRFPASVLQLHPDVMVVADESALQVIHEKKLL